MVVWVTDTFSAIATPTPAEELEEAAAADELEEAAAEKTPSQCLKAPSLLRWRRSGSEDAGQAVK